MRHPDEVREKKTDEYTLSVFYWQHTLNPKSFYVFALLRYQKYISSRGFINHISTRMQWLKRVTQVIETKWQKPGFVNSKGIKVFPQSNYRIYRCLMFKVVGFLILNLTASWSAWLTMGMKAKPVLLNWERSCPSLKYKLYICIYWVSH